MRLKTSNKGFTLIELIISIAIFGIIAITFSGMFISGLKGLSRSGNNSKAAYTCQQAIEKRLYDVSLTGTENADITSTDSTEPAFSFTFNNIDGTDPKVVTLNGNIKSVQYDDGKQNFKLDAFVSTP